MKTIKTTIALLAIAIFASSCSKSDDAPVVVTPPVASSYRLISDRLNNYDYDAEGRLTKKTRKSATTDFIKYTYNSFGKLTQIEDNSNLNSYVYDNTTYVYDSSGKVESTLRNYKGTASGSIDTKTKTDFLYNSTGQISRKNYSLFTNNQYVLYPDFSTFEYNSVGKISKIINPANGYGISYYEFTYDLNANLTEIKQFKLTAGSTTVSYLNTKYQYVYGIKKDVFYKLFPETIYSSFPFSYSSPNNELDEISSYYNETGLISSNTSTKSLYIYNDGGYPVKEVGATTDEYIYQKY